MSDRFFEISGYEYRKDDYGSCHRCISREDYLKTLSYYRGHIFIDGEFEAIEGYDFGVENLKQRFENDRLRMEGVYNVLEFWGLDFTNASSLLDIGCGYGSFLNVFHARTRGRAYGIELSSKSIELSKLLNPEIEVASFDTTSVEAIISAKEITTIVTLDIIEHLMDVESFLKTLYAVCPRGVNLIVELPVIHPAFGYDELKNFRYLYPTRHLHLYTPKGIIQLFKSVGFELANATFFKNEYKYLMCCLKN